MVSSDGLVFRVAPDASSHLLTSALPLLRRDGYRYQHACVSSCGCSPEAHRAGCVL